MARHHRSRVRVTAAGVMLCIAGSGFLLARCGADRHDPARLDSRAVSAPHGEDVDRRGVSASTAAGPAADEPVAAAVTYATAAQDWLYLTDEQLRAAVEGIATPDAAAVLADEVAADIAMAREQLAASAGRVWWLVRPLAWRVESQTDTRARVSVWTVTILSAAGVALPQSEYVTVTLDLQCIEGVWRVDAVRDEPGPTPVTGPKDQPWDADAFDDTLAGFTRMGSESQP